MANLSTVSTGPTTPVRSDLDSISISTEKADEGYASNLELGTSTPPPSPDTGKVPDISLAKDGSSVIVDFDGPQDPLLPMNWSMKRKVFTVTLYGLLTMGATWATSSYSTAVPAISRHFDVAPVVSALGLTLFMIGFGIGPLLWAPLSEVYGRRVPTLIPCFVGAVFTFGTGAGKDIQTILLTRFFAGFFCSAPTSNTGGVLADLFPPHQRGAALAGYSIAVAGGPLIAPIAGGAIINAHGSWRWAEYLTGILMASTFLLGFIWIKETDASTLLVQRARPLRLEKGDWALHARHEEMEIDMKKLASRYLIVPLQLTVTPICFLLNLYASFVYGILYLTFSAFPIEFREASPALPAAASLPFLGTLVGSFIGMAINVANNSYYARQCLANNGKPVPEARLPPMMVGGVAFAGGLFLFGWSSSPTIHWLAPVAGAALIGLGFLTIFQASLNYLIDTFQRSAASALASNTVMRCLFAAVLPLVAPFMFRGLGVAWAASVLGLVAVAMVPIP
ncbi:hypothetical protein MBLNU459_g2381t1 [Dothideomycetes sp. NU459]